MAGAGFKTFNTGDVLTSSDVNTYLMQQTVMVFDDASARSTALPTPSEGMLSYLKDTNAVEVYDGSSWVASDDPNAIQNTIVDAKGDLISASADNVPARLAVGNNGETLVADSSATTGLRWQGQFMAGKNAIINGNMNVWQRGTSGFTTSANYTADRWYFRNDGTAGNITISRQTTSDTTNLPFIQYGLRVQRNSGSTSTGGVYLAQSMESATMFRFIGQPVTLSFYARKGANYSASSNNLSVVIVRGTGTDQNILVSYTGEASVASSTITLTDTWTRYTLTGTVPTAATELAVYFGFTPTGTASTNDWYEITGVQLEQGSVATPFTTATGTLAGELAACQRYYYRSDASSGVSTGIGAGSTSVRGVCHLPVQMRIDPSSIDYSGLNANDTGAETSVTAVASWSNGATAPVVTFTSTSITQYRPYIIYGTYIAFNAEL